MESTAENAFNMEMMGPKRPQFLTVICVLSFIMCGLSVLFGIWGIIQNNPEKMAQNIEELRSVSPEMADRMEEQMIEMQENTYNQISPYINFIFILLSFLGTYMMWQLKKNGFYIYLAGELLPYLGFIFAGKQAMAMMGASGGGTAQMAGMIVIVFMLLFDIAFFVMYGLNLKHMKDN